MSIKGNLSEISFAELLKVISKYNGRLGMWNFQDKKNYECFLQNENVVYVNINGQDALDAHTINTFLAEISCDRQSYYAFQKDARLDFKPTINLAVSKILSATVLAQSTADDIEQLLPNPQTRFEIVPDFSANLSGDLGAFWDLSTPHLHAGCSPTELSDRLGIAVREVQMHFYKLRMVKAIRPVRLFNVSKVSAKAKTAGANLQRIVNLKNGVKPSRSYTANPTPQLAANALPLAVGLTEPRIKESVFTEADSFENIELDKIIDLPGNDHFINTYLPDRNAQAENPPTDVSLEAQNTVEKSSETGNPVKQPVFDLKSPLVKQGLVKRMLSSLFSRKTH